MIAFATRETEDRALKALLEVARICDEANNIRGTTFGQASMLTPHDPTHMERVLRGRYQQPLVLAA